MQRIGWYGGPNYRYIGPKRALQPTFDAPCRPRSAPRPRDSWLLTLLSHLFEHTLVIRSHPPKSRVRLLLVRCVQAPRTLLLHDRRRELDVPAHPPSVQPTATHPSAPSLALSCFFPGWLCFHHARSQLSSVRGRSAHVCATVCGGPGITREIGQGTSERVRARARVRERGWA